MSIEGYLDPSRRRASLIAFVVCIAILIAAVLVAWFVQIDRGRGLVQRGSRTINLTPTEFRLLVYLAQHPGQVLSREQILDGVWGYAPDVESESVVTVHIRRLREKIELDPGHPRLVLTVPGIGYRLVG